jgi:hypothetical protein
MRVEHRNGPRGPSLCLVVESREESHLLDAALGKTVVDDDGLISRVQGEVRLSDGYGEHYISLHAAEGGPEKKDDGGASRPADRPYFTDERRPTVEEIKGCIDKAGRLKITIGLPLGRIACSSDNETYDGLNDVVDEILGAPDGIDGILLDITYDPVGVVPGGGDEEGLVLVEVGGDASNLFEDYDPSLSADDRAAAYAATGCGLYELDDSEISEYVNKHAGSPLSRLREDERDKAAAFDRAGGRGAELADEIDSLRVAIAIREVRKED